MIDTALQAAARNALALHPDKRVLSFSYKDKLHYIKQKLSNGRNRFAKADVSTAFWCEVYKIAVVRQYFPLAPRIVCLQDDYFVMEDAGIPLQRVAADNAYAPVRRRAFYLAGEGLSRLHAAGLHHGRPALRDIAYSPEEDAVTFLDWESEKSFIHAPREDIDILLFIHSCFRERWPDTALIDSALEGYRTVEGGSDRLTALIGRMLHHRLLFTMCQRLHRFHWTDVQAAEDTYLYLEHLPT